MSANLWVKLFLGSTLVMFSTGCGLARLFGANEEFRSGFMNACQKDPSYNEYCQCALDEVVKNTTFFQRLAPTAKIQAEGEKAGKICLSKVPPASVRKEFVDQCVAGSQAPRFCECGFEYLKAKGRLADGESGVTAEQDAMKEACKAQLFEDSRELFVKSCLSSAGEGKEAMCTCAFGKLEEKFGRDGLLKEMEANSPALEEAAGQAGAACQK